MNKILTYEERYKILEDMGARPRDLQMINPHFFKMIMKRVRTPYLGTPFNTNNYMFELSNREYRKNFIKEESPDLDKEGTEVKFRNKSGKKNVVGGFRKK